MEQKQRGKWWLLESIGKIPQSFHGAAVHDQLSGGAMIMHFDSFEVFIYIPGWKALSALSSSRFQSMLQLEQNLGYTVYLKSDCIEKAGAASASSTLKQKLLSTF